jgi:hypothetical protein
MRRSNSFILQHFFEAISVVNDWTNNHPRQVPMIGNPLNL